MGLMEGLTSLDFTSSEGTMASIPVLLDGMRFAFATSVTGIACSLVFNMANKIASGHALRALNNFEEAFYELAMPRPLDADVQLLCSKQDEEDRMNRMAQTIGNQMAASLEMALSQSMAPLNRTVDTFVRGATQDQAEAMRGVVHQFFQQMNASLNGQMSALADTMNMVNQGQVQTQKNLQSTLNTSQSMTENARMMQLVSSDIAKNLKEISQRLDQQLVEQDQRMSNAEEAGRQLADQLASLSDSLSRMQQAVDRLTGELEGPSGEDA